MTIHAVPVSDLRHTDIYIALGDGSALPLNRDQLTHALAAVAPEAGDETLTTGQAADILGVSPKTVARLIDAGELTSMRYGSRGHRLVKRSAVEQYRKQTQKRRRSALSQMRRAIQDGQLDDIDHGSYLADLS